MSSKLGTILYIGGELPDRSASAHRILANCKAMREYGYDVVIISATKDDISEVQEDIVQGFKVYYLPHPKNLKQWMGEFISADKHLEIIRGIKDLKGVVCYNHRALPLLQICKYCHKRGLAVFADETEWHTSGHLSSVKSLIKKADTALRIRYAQKKTDGIIAISSFFTDYYKDCDNVITVPPLVDKEEAKWHITQREESDVRRFSYAGNMAVGKDLLNICIDIFNEICEMPFEFNIMGCTKEQYLSIFPDDEAALEKLGSKVNFHGFLSHTEAIKQTMASDFTLIIRERNRKNESGFPTKFAESISCKTPVIVTDFSDVKQYTKQYGLGLMIGSTENLKSGILSAIDMPKEELAQYYKNCEECSAFDYKAYIEKIGKFIDAGIKKYA